MGDLLAQLSAYPIWAVLTIIVLFALVVREVVNFIDWAKLRLNKHYEEQHQDDEDHQMILNRIDEDENLINEHFNKDEAWVKELEEEHAVFKSQFTTLEEWVLAFQRMSRHEIKGWITKEHHYFMEKGWIDDFSLDCIERRFSDYDKLLHGNSFVADLMEDLRKLPRQPLDKN